MSICTWQDQVPEKRNGRWVVVEHTRVQRLTAPHDRGVVFGRIEEAYRSVIKN